MTEKERLEQRLAERKHAITSRIDSLEEEIASAPAALLAKVAQNPFVGLGAMVGAGLVVGLIFGGRRRRSSKAEPPHRRLIEEYFDAIGEEVARSIESGRSPHWAVRETLRKRAPVVVYAPATHDGGPRRSILREAGWLAMQTALGVAIKMAGDMFVAGTKVGATKAMHTASEEQDDDSEPVRSEYRDLEPAASRRIPADSGRRSAPRGDGV